MYALKVDQMRGRIKELEAALAAARVTIETQRRTIDTQTQCVDIAAQQLAAARAEVERLSWCLDEAVHLHNEHPGSGSWSRAEIEARYPAPPAEEAQG